MENRLIVKFIPTEDKNFLEWKEKWLTMFNTLLAEKGIKKAIEIDGSQEGKELPGGLESESGLILTDQGRIYSFWTDWDPDKVNPHTGEKTGYYTLGDPKFYNDPQTGQLTKDDYWNELAPQSYINMHKDPRYLEAKKELGLTEDYIPPETFSDENNSKEI